MSIFNWDSAENTFGFSASHYKGTIEAGVYYPQHVQVFALPHIDVGGDSWLQVRGYLSVERRAPADELGPSIAFGLVGVLGVIATAASVFYVRRADRRASVDNRPCGVCLRMIADMLKTQPSHCATCGSIEIPDCEFCGRPSGPARVFQTRSLVHEAITTQPSRKCSTCGAVYFVECCMTEPFGQTRASLDSSLSFVTAGEVP
ncbi:hypothetical protein FQN54_009342 [Arachnomyces sp. PD_36]|nr:hypothetical protein FQN54_009342 [Arachnomyces sp. PD_36]